MKDIVITGKRIKIELFWLLASFIVANICNAIAIWKYNASPVEMITSFFYVLVFTVFLYIVSVIIRLILFGIMSLVKK